MLKESVLALLASLAMLSNANAAATVAFQTKVKHWYEEAPLALQRAIWKPRVAVYAVADMAELRALNPRAADMKGRDDVLLMGFARTRAGQVPSLTFVEASMSQAPDERQHRVVLHEMMHVYDVIGRTKSNDPIFLSNFKADMADIKKYLKTASASDRERASKYEHYMEEPAEAFAEAAARLLLPPSKEADRTNFEFVFPRVTKYMQLTLKKAGIITGNEQPPQAQAPKQQVLDQRNIEEVAADAKARIE